MATDIGTVYLDVEADTSKLKRQIRRAAKEAGKTFGKEFSDEAEKSSAPGLSRMANQISQKLGKDAGQETGREWSDGMITSIKRRNKDFDAAIRESFVSADWGDLISEFDDLDDAYDRINKRLTEIGRQRGPESFNSQMKDTGITVDSVRQQLKAYVDETNNATQAANEQAAAEKERTAALKKQATESAEASRQMRDQERLLQESMRQSAKDVEARNKMFRDDSTRNATADLKLLSQQYKGLTDEVGDSNKALAVFRKAGDTKKQQTQVAQLQRAYDGVEREIKQVWAEGEVAAKRLVAGSKEWNESIQETAHRLTLLKAQLATLRDQHLDIEVDVDTPGKVAMTIAGAIDGHAYQQAFEAASSDVGGGLKRQFMMLAQAFPAAVTALVTPLGAAIGVALAAPLATLASSVTGILTAALSSIAVAAGGAALAVAGIGVAAAYAVALGVKSFDQFKTKFPETQRALDSLKDSFENVDVPMFAKQWSASIKDFAQTLADSLRFDTVAENLGKATAEITDAFTAVLKSPAWTNFVDAIEGPFSRALASIGTGLAEWTSVFLQFMTAAAPLAEHLGQMFLVWSMGIERALGTEEGQAKLTNFFRQATAALDIIIPMIGDFAEIIGNVFTLGADQGTAMLGVIGGLVTEFKNWTNSAEGIKQIGTWFKQAGQIFNELIPLFEAIGGMIGSMVTQRSIDMLGLFIDSVARILPFLGDLFNAIGDFGLLDLFAEALAIVAESLRPLIPLLDAVGIAFHDGMVVVLDALRPILVEMGQILGVLFNALIPLVGPIFQIAAGLLALDPARVTKGFDDLTAALQPALDGILEFINQAVDFALRMIPALVGALADMVPALLGGLTTLLGGLVEAVAKTIPKVVDAIAKMLPKILDAIRDMIPRLLNAAKETFEVLAKAIDEVLPQIMDAVTNIVPEIITVLKDNVPLLVNAAKDFFTGMVDALAVVVPELMKAWVKIGPTIIGALGQMAVLLLQGAIQMFTTLVTALIETIPILTTTFTNDVLPAIITTLTTLGPQLVTAAVDLFIALVDGLTEAIPPLLTAIADLMPDIENALTLLIPDLITAGTTLFESLTQAVSDNTGPITTAITNLMPSIARALTSMIPQLITAGVTLFVSLTVAVAKASPEIATALSNSIPVLTKELTKDGNLQKMIAAGVTLFGAIAGAVVQVAPTIAGALASMLTGVAGQVAGSVAGQFVRVGTSMIDGIIAGVGSAAGRLARTVANAAGSAWQAAKDAIGFGSPAKKFIPLGESTMQGWQVGVERAMPSMLAATARAGAAAAGAASAFAPGVSASAFGVNPARGAGNQSTPSGRVLAGATVASGAIQIVTPTRDPAIVANMVLDGIVARAQ